MTGSFLRGLLGFCVVACSSPSIDGEGQGATLDSSVDDVPITGDVTHYDYRFDLASGQAITGLDVAVHAPGGNCFVTDLALPAVSNSTWNGSSARSATVSGSTLQICGDTVAGGAPLTISAGASVPRQTFFNLDVGFSSKRDLSGGSFSYLLGWVEGCSHLGPCDSAPSQLSTYHITVDHAASDVVLCPGELTSGVATTQCAIGGTAAPTYSSLAVASDPLWQRNDFVTAAGVDVVFYEVPAGRIARSLDRTSVAAFLTWITGLLGPYPYGTELRVAGAPTKWLGFEHPANLIVDQRLPFSGPYQDSGMHVLMHETIHQWAGNRTTIASVADFAWKEAIAEYLSYVFEDEHRAPEEAAQSLLYWTAVGIQARHFLRPTDVPTPAIQDFYGDVYGPGPMMFVQLESMLGRPAMLAGITQFLAAPGARTFDELRAALEAATGANLAPYFAAWVFGSGMPEWPTFAIATSQTGNQVTVTATQQNVSGKRYGCKLEVEVHGATSSALATINFGVAPTSTTASATVTLAEPVASTVFDPHHRVIGRLAGAPAMQGKPVQVWPL